MMQMCGAQTGDGPVRKEGKLTKTGSVADSRIPRNTPRSAPFVPAVMWSFPLKTKISIPNTLRIKRSSEMLLLWSEPMMAENVWRCTNTRFLQKLSSKYKQCLQRPVKAVGQRRLERRLQLTAPCQYIFINWVTVRTNCFPLIVQSDKCELWLCLEIRFNRVKLQTVKENTGWGAVLLLQQQGGAVELSLNAARFDVDAVWRPAASSLTHSQTLSASLPLTMDRLCVCVCLAFWMLTPVLDPTVTVTPLLPSFLYYYQQYFSTTAGSNSTARWLSLSCTVGGIPLMKNNSAATSLGTLCYFTFRLVWILHFTDSTSSCKHSSEI